MATVRDLVAELTDVTLRRRCGDQTVFVVPRAHSSTRSGITTGTPIATSTSSRRTRREHGHVAGTGGGGSGQERSPRGSSSRNRCAGSRPRTDLNAVVRRARRRSARRSGLAGRQPPPRSARRHSAAREGPHRCRRLADDLRYAAVRTTAAPRPRTRRSSLGLRAAGAIVVGKTNTPAFGWTAYTDNKVFGATRNPWNRERSPGGSSGGSAAALAAGLAPLATTTDGGGSVRIPAVDVRPRRLQADARHHRTRPRAPLDRLLHLGRDGCDGRRRRARDVGARGPDRFRHQRAPRPSSSSPAARLRRASSRAARFRADVDPAIAAAFDATLTRDRTRPRPAVTVVTHVFEPGRPPVPLVPDQLR